MPLQFSPLFLIAIAVAVVALAAALYIWRVRDIPARIRSADELEQRTAEFQTILQAFPDLMFRLDDNGRFLGYAASPQAPLYLQPDQFLGRRVDEVLPEPIGQQVLDALWRARLENAPQAAVYSTAG